jgi:hypothetical protein
MDKETKIIVGKSLANHTLHGMFLELQEIKDFIATADIRPDDLGDLEDLVCVGEDAIAGKIDRIATLLEALDIYTERLKDALEHNKNKINCIKAMVVKTLEQTPAHSMQGLAYTAKLVRNGGQTPLEIEPDLLPSDYVDEIIEIKRKPRQALIRTDLEAGKSIPGVVPRERGLHVRFKPL